MLSLLLLALPAFAQESSDEDEELFTEPTKKTEKVDDGEFNSLEGEDDFSDFQVAEKEVGEVKVKKGEVAVGTNRATQLPYDVVGKTPLKDNYPAQVVFVDRDAVVVELPVLLARGGEFDGKSYWLVTEVYVDGMKVAEARQQVTRNALAKSGPSLAFVKILVPVPAATGSLELRVGQATTPNGTPAALFTQQVPYNLGG